MIVVMALVSQMKHSKSRSPQVNLLICKLYTRSFHGRSSGRTRAKQGAGPFGNWEQLPLSSEPPPGNATNGEWKAELIAAQPDDEAPIRRGEKHKYPQPYKVEVGCRAVGNIVNPASRRQEEAENNFTVICIRRNMYSSVAPLLRTI
jgi:hypothetical protein